MGSAFPRRDGGLGGHEASREERLEWERGVAAGTGTPTLQRFMQALARYHKARLASATHELASARDEAESLGAKLSELKQGGERSVDVEREAYQAKQASD